jgi:cation:H+ antiporter
MLDSLAAAVFLFLLASVIITIAGTNMARVADQLADRTGLGEAIVGAFLLAGATSLPDFAATLSAAIDLRPELAVSNVMGSMAANLVFLAIADIMYRKANLEHAAVSTASLTQAALLIALLGISLYAASLEYASTWYVHPVTFLIVGGYVYGIFLTRRTQERPMWFPRRTAWTVQDSPSEDHKALSLSGLWWKFSVLALVTAVAGWMLMEAAKVLVDQTTLSEGLAGGVFTAIATSTPELVITIAAIRRGALTLALGNIVGTNCFNVLVLAAADVGYHQGSIYHDISGYQVVWGLAAIVMTAVLLLGLIQRQPKGLGTIGFESVTILAIYAATVTIMLF